MATSQVALNIDVLRLILIFCDTRDLLQASAACWQLRDEAVKELISRPVHLKNYAQVESFCRLVLSGDQSRPRFIRILILETQRSLHAPGPHLLLEVINRATQLRVLQLRWCDSYFEFDQRFAGAVRDLEHLRHLEISTSENKQDGKIAAMLLGLRSPLKTLELTDAADNGFGDTFPDTLAQRQNRLETLRIFYPGLDLMQWTPFHFARKLDLTIGDRRISLERLASIFPNLREVAVRAHYFEIDLTSPSIETMQTREDAIAFQRSGGGWQSLDKITGTIGDLYVLCITCPVRCVDLGYYQSQACRAFLDVVSRTRPRQVELMVLCASWVPVWVQEHNILVYEGVDGPGAVSHAIFRLTLSISSPVNSKDVLVSHIT